MDEAWWYHAKWIKSDMPYDFAQTWNIKTNKKPKKKEHIDTENRKAVTRGET